MTQRLLGITLPIERGTTTGYFNATSVVVDQLRSNLTNLLLTKKGERMFQPTFGCNIHSLVFEPQTDDTMAEIRASIAAAVREWMPFVKVESIILTKDEATYKVFVKLVFSLASSRNITDSIVLVY